jgi:hypothetical protein
LADRVTLTRAFAGAGRKSDDAERITTKIYDALRNNVATKAALKELEQRLDRGIDQMTIRWGALDVMVAGPLFAALQR